MVPSLVREDRDGQTSGLPVVPPGAPLGIRVWLGKALKASKCEAIRKMRTPLRVVVDDDVDRLQV